MAKPLQYYLRGKRCCNVSRKGSKSKNYLYICNVIARRTKDLVGRITVNAVFFVVLRRELVGCKTQSFCALT